MRAVNLDTYGLSLLTAKEDIAKPRSSTNWALFRYDGITNNLKLSDSGVGGLTELVGKFHPNVPFYGLCRVGTDGAGRPRILLIAWVGEGVDQYRKTECASHLPAIKAFFKEAHICVSAQTLEDVTEERISAMFSKPDTSASSEKQGSPHFADRTASVGTNYKRTIAAMEMQRINRDSFWARSEREEEERKEEERRRAAEARRLWERERIEQELKEAEERERKMEEKEKMLQEQRRLQEKTEEETRKQEMLRWEQQQREEEEEDRRAGLKQSQYEDKAAEAATLVSQRSVNPREFFRQLSSSSSSQPGATHGGRPPFHRYNRSLTEAAFIFQRSDSATPADSHSPPVKPRVTLAYESVPSQIQGATDFTLPGSPPASGLSPFRTSPVSIPSLEQFPPLHCVDVPQQVLVSSCQSQSAETDAADLLGSYSKIPPSSQDPEEEDFLGPAGGYNNIPFLDTFCPEGPVTTEMGNEVDLEEGLEEQSTLVNPSDLPVPDCRIPVVESDSNILLVPEEEECDKPERDGTSVAEVKMYDDRQVPGGTTDTDTTSVMQNGMSLLVHPLSSSVATSAMEDEKKEEVEESTTTLDLIPKEAECNCADAAIIDEVGTEEKALQRYETPTGAADQSRETSLQRQKDVVETLVDITDHGSTTGDEVMDNVDEPTVQTPLSESSIGLDWISNDPKPEDRNGISVEDISAEQTHRSKEDDQDSDLMSFAVKPDKTMNNVLSEEGKETIAKNGDELQPRLLQEFLCE